MLLRIETDLVFDKKETTGDLPGYTEGMGADRNLSGCSQRARRRGEAEAQRDLKNELMLFFGLRLHGRHFPPIIYIYVKCIVCLNQTLPDKTLPVSLQAEMESGESQRKQLFEVCFIKRNKTSVLWGCRVRGVYKV